MCQASRLRRPSGPSIARRAHRCVSMAHPAPTTRGDGDHLDRDARSRDRFPPRGPVVNGPATAGREDPKSLGVTRGLGSTACSPPHCRPVVTRPRLWIDSNLFDGGFR